MVRGGYTFDEIRRMSNEELLFLNHYQNIVEEEKQKFWTDSLGIIWDAEEFKKPKATTVGGYGKKPDKLFIPLSMAVNPEVVTMVKENLGMIDGKSGSVPYVGGGEFVPKGNVVVNDMSHLSKDEFKKMIGAR